MMGVLTVSKIREMLSHPALIALGVLSSYN